MLNKYYIGLILGKEEPIMKNLVVAVISILIGFVAVSQAEAVLIDFDELANGTQLWNQYKSSYGLKIRCNNPNRDDPDRAITFDTMLDNTADPDLEFPWSGGNAATEKFGNVLIIAENLIDADGDGLVDDPDDEGSQPAGHIRFVFDNPITAFGFSFIDVDGSGGEEPKNYKVNFYLGGTKVGQLNFKQYKDIDSTIIHGNHFANHYPVITASYIGSPFDKVRVRFAGSGAIDNIYFCPIPEPMTMVLFGSGLLGLGIFKRRREP